MISDIIFESSEITLELIDITLELNDITLKFSDITFLAINSKTAPYYWYHFVTMIFQPDFKMAYLS